MRVLKVTLISVIVIGILIYAHYLITGQPIWQHQTVAQLPVVSDLLNTKTQPERLYKWQDEHGVWQYTSDPPSENIASEIISVHANTNVVLPVQDPADSSP